jgi:hypothetical protein
VEKPVTAARALGAYDAAVLPSEVEQVIGRRNPGSLTPFVDVPPLAERCGSLKSC